MNREDIVSILVNLDSIIGQTETEVLISPPKLRALCTQLTELNKCRDIYLSKLKAYDAKVAEAQMAEKKPTRTRKTKEQ